MIYECFLDDSKDATQAYSYVCGGFIARASTWKKFRVDWDAQLKAEGIGYFKTSEYRMLEGEFARFRLLKEPYGRQAADAVRDRLVSVVAKYEGIHGIAVAIPVQVFSSLKNHPSAAILSNLQIYDAAFQEVLNLAVLKIDVGYVAFTHDDGPDFDRLRAIYNVFCKTNHRYRAPKMGGFISLDDTLHGPLQISDMLANSVMRNHTEMQVGKSNGHYFSLWDKSDLRVMDENEAFKILSHELRRRGHEVPVDLVPYLPELIPDK